MSGVKADKDRSLCFGGVESCLLFGTPLIIIPTGADGTVHEEFSTFSFCRKQWTSACHNCVTNNIVSETAEHLQQGIQGDPVLGLTG